MDFKLNVRQYPSADLVKNEVVRYMRSARSGLGLSMSHICKICKQNHVSDISAGIWRWEAQNRNITMPSFWMACAVYRIRMAIFKNNGELGLCIEPSFENNYSVIGKKLGDVLKEIRIQKGVSIDNVARETGNSWGVIDGIEKGTRVPRLDKVLELMFSYELRVDFEQTNI